VNYLKLLFKSVPISKREIKGLLAQISSIFLLPDLNRIKIISFIAAYSNNFRTLAAQEEISIFWKINN